MPKRIRPPEWKEYVKRWTKQRIKDGFCPKCGAKRDTELAWCSICRAKANSHTTKMRQEHPELLDKQKKILHAHKQKIYDLVRKAKEQPCHNCGKTYPYYVMDFDHIRGKKNFLISHAITNTTSIMNIEKEMAKCDLICANCHRIRTWNKRKKKKGKWSVAL